MTVHGHCVIVFRNDFSHLLEAVVVASALQQLVTMSVASNECEEIVRRVESTAKSWEQIWFQRR
jgi:hypothetical protein